MKRARKRRPPSARFRVLTYHHSWLPAGQCTDANEYTAPRVPVKAEAEGSMLRLSLGRRTPDEDVNPAVILERQTDRWVVVVHSHDGDDAELLVFVMDDGRVVAVPESAPPAKNLEYSQALPPPLPAEKRRYPIPEVKPRSKE